MKVIQLSDTHLFADDTLQIFGTKSNIKFKEVINKIINEEIHDTDLILLTGDISQDETTESYQIIAHVLANLNIPVYWVPGNHDHLARLESVFHGTKNFQRQTALTLPNWHLIFLNTKLEDRNEGYLSESEINILRNEISNAPLNKKLAIIMHHHPAPVGTPLIDQYILKNTQDFWDTVKDDRVALIVCGHVHGDYRLKFNNIMIESSPATCFQFEKGTTNLKTDAKIGYKIYYFDENHYRTVTKIW